MAPLPQSRDLAAVTAWAAVGAVPAAVGLEPCRRVELSQLPLLGMPSWLGIDRALAGWQAWRESGGAVLVADAGTALSLTRVDGEGRFAGGRLQAGAALQWRALAATSDALPALAVDGAWEPDPWPAATAAALRVGVLRGLAAAVQGAWQEVRQEDPSTRLWITGGDGPALAALLGEPCDGQLVLRGLAQLSPGPDH